MNRSVTAHSYAPLYSLPVIVAALGYFVDVYDLLLFNIVRVPSLTDLGLNEEQVSIIGARVYNWQQAGLLIGGFFWGILGDKLGRRSVLFGSIITYSIANLLCGFTYSIEFYIVLRFLAGLGLAGELGAGITLIAEILPKELRGYGAAVVAGVGLAGAIAAFFTVSLFDWRNAYFIGGGMGLALLFMRFNVLESYLFTQNAQLSAKRGSLWILFSDKSRVLRYLRCMGIAFPTYLIIGIYATFGNEIAAALGIHGVTAGDCILFTYLGIVTGDLLSGVISQLLKSRRKAIAIMIGMTALGTAALLSGIIKTPEALYASYTWLGFSIGYIAMFLTTTAEQFGTNLRATVTTSIANNVRATTLITLPVFQLLKPNLGTLNSALIVGIVCFLVALISLWNMEETFNKDLDFLEE